ncbi:MAG: hypothetical protein JWP77_2602 [Polaromonas sp.]|nr:hypothetical protein [Polaromonas sp.]
MLSIAYANAKKTLFAGATARQDEPRLIHCFGMQMTG